MTLRIYKGSGGIGPISQDDLFTNPVSFSVSEEGGISEQRFYLRSDTPSAEIISDGKIYAQDSVSFDDSAWISFALDADGSAGLYEEVVSFEIGLNEEVPFWIKVEVPSAQIRGTKTDIDIVTEYISVDPVDS